MGCTHAGAFPLHTDSVMAGSFGSIVSKFLWSTKYAASSAFPFRSPGYSFVSSPRSHARRLQERTWGKAACRRGHVLSPCELRRFCEEVNERDVSTTRRTVTSQV